MSEHFPQTVELHLGRSDCASLYVAQNDWLQHSNTKEFNINTG